VYPRGGESAPVELADEAGDAERGVGVEDLLGERSSYSFIGAAGEATANSWLWCSPP
jgi:hypothetical protein